MCEWVMEWVIPLRLLRLLEHLAVLTTGVTRGGVTRCDVTEEEKKEKEEEEKDKEKEEKKFLHTDGWANQR